MSGPVFLPHGREAEATQVLNSIPSGSTWPFVLVRDGSTLTVIFRASRREKFRNVVENLLTLVEKRSQTFLVFFFS